MDDKASVYTGVRGALVGYPSGNGGWSESITVPIGVSVATIDSIRFIVEAGVLFGWEQFNGSSASARSSQPVHQTRALITSTRCWGPGSAWSGCAASA